MQTVSDTLAHHAVTVLSRVGMKPREVIAPQLKSEILPEGVTRKVRVKRDAMEKNGQREFWHCGKKDCSVCAEDNLVHPPVEVSAGGTSRFFHAVEILGESMLAYGEEEKLDTNRVGCSGGIVVQPTVFLVTSAALRCYTLP